MAALFVPGSAFTVDATNSPGTFTEATNLTAGSVVLGTGTLNLTISIVDDGPTDQWLLFNYSTVSGSVFTSPSNNWGLTEIGLDAAVDVFLTASFVEFLSDSDVLTPTSSIFGGYTVMSNPIPGGVGIGLGIDGLSLPFSAGPLSAFPSIIDPWSALDATGVDSTQVNGFLIALKFAPQSAPEPPGIPVPFCGDVHTATSLKFAWTPTGGPASSFTVDWRKVGDMSFTEVTGITDDFLVVTGLTPGTTYEFKVKAVP